MPDQINELPEDERKEIEEKVRKFQNEFGKSIQQQPKWQREAQNKIKELSREVVKTMVDSLLDELKKKYEDLPEVINHLDAVRDDLIDHADQFQQTREKEQQPKIMPGLQQPDQEFADFFKVAADFEENIDRNPESTSLYARWVATLVRRDKLKAFDKDAVGRVIEQASRISGDAEKISIKMRDLTDLLQEADYWAGEQGHDVVYDMDVQNAIDSRIFRADRIRSRLREEVEKGRLLIDTEGEQIGQVNGLSVLSVGEVIFGNPTRITARVRVGQSKVVDIEREAKLGGSIHSKGILIMSGFIAGRYLPQQPLSMLASLVFEQSYSEVEGDSASSAELYALPGNGLS